MSRSRMHLAELIRAVGARNLVWPVIAGTLTLLSALSLTVVSAWLITRSWQMPPIMDITVAVTAVRALGISRAAFRYIDRLASHHVALSTATKARIALWKSLTASQDAFFYATNAGQSHNTAEPGRPGDSRGVVLRRLGEDIDAVADVVVRALIPMLVAALTSILAIAFTAIASPVAAVVLAAGLVVAGIAAPMVIYRGVHISQLAHTQALTEHAAAVDRILSDSPSLRIHGQLPEALARARDTTLDVAQANRSGATAIARGDGVATAASMFSVVMTFIVALLSSQQSPEWVTILVLIPLAAFEAVAALPAAAKTLAITSLPAGELSGGELPVGGTHAPTPPTEWSAPRLVARNLVTGYDKDLAEWNLDLPFGTRKEIIAPSGSGKTTLLRTLAGLLPARGGSITVSSASGHTYHLEPNTHLEEPCAAGLPIRFIAEDEHIFATTIRDNIAIGNPTISDEQIHQLLVDLSLNEWVSQLPEGIDTVLTSGGHSLSGGQRRRLILARALSSPAPILLLDEPTEHIDDDATEILHMLLQQHPLPGLLPQRTVVVVRHPRD